MSYEVAIVMGSDSDFEKMKPAIKELKSLEVSFKVRVLSAHRTPVELDHFITDAQYKGAKVFIAGAGLSAMLPGAIAAKTMLPVIGVPLSADNSLPMDSVISSLQMPPGIPVLVVGLNAAKNAAIAAARIIATNNEDLAKRLLNSFLSAKNKVLKADKEIEERISQIE